MSSRGQSMGWDKLRPYKDRTHPLAGPWSSEAEFQKALGSMLERAGHWVAYEARCKMPGRTSSKYERGRVDLYVYVAEDCDLRDIGVRSFFIECKLDDAQHVHACRQVRGYFQEAFEWRTESGSALPRPDMGFLAMPCSGWNGREVGCIDSATMRHLWIVGCGGIELSVGMGIRASTPAIHGHRQTFHLADWP